VLDQGEAILMRNRPHPGHRGFLATVVNDRLALSVLFNRRRGWLR
jgi:hypothetical protein